LVGQLGAEGADSFEEIVQVGLRDPGSTSQGTFGVFTITDPAANLVEEASTQDIKTDHAGSKVLFQSEIGIRNSEIILAFLHSIIKLHSISLFFTKPFDPKHLKPLYTTIAIPGRRKFIQSLVDDFSYWHSIGTDNINKTGGRRIRPEDT
jgi:hypothetical protein